MASSCYFYLRLPVRDLERLLEDYQTEFDALLEDTFSDEELQKYAPLIDSLAAVYAQPLSKELTFDDFYNRPDEEDKQREFFQASRSCLCFDHLPYLEGNPFQVTYLLDLLWSFDEVLIDRGGVSELCFRKDFVEELKRYKNLHDLVPDEAPRLPEVKTTVPVTPIDFLVVDVYRELDRLKGIELDTSSLSEKALKILSAMKEGHWDSETLFRKSGLIPKDFDDALERLKFWLRKI